MNTSNTGVTYALGQQKMAPLQIRVVIICWILNTLDGFDLFIIAFAAPVIRTEWGVTPEQLGLLFSSGVAGMTVASFLLAPLADIYGRRNTILAFLVVITVGLFATAAAPSLNLVIAARFLTGLGIGAILASLNTLVAEYSSEERRNFALSFMHLGFTAGAILGGLVAASIIGVYGWRSIFVLAGVVSTLMLPVVFFGLPESIDFLLTKQPKKALKKANEILARIGRTALTSLPAKQTVEKRPKLSTLFSPATRRSTFALWGAFFCAFATLFFFQSWLPTILTEAGLALSQGISANIFYGIGGAVGMLLLGYHSTRIGLFRMIKWYFFGCMLAIVALSFVGTQLNLIIILATAIGFFVYGCIAGLFAIAARLYPANIRTTGVGWAIGIGRIGSTGSPVFAGLLFAAGWSSEIVYWVFAVPQILGLLLMFLIRLPETQESTA
ncbi:MAG: MFS transporter [Candidatus Rariloculaceae bacterium]